MGRIRPTFIKRTGEEILQRYKERLKEDFEHNKKFLQDLINSGVLASPSKKMRNRVAGYLVRAVRPTHNPIYKASAETLKAKAKARRFVRR